jgi:hypothetical protein
MKRRQFFTPAKLKLNKTCKKIVFTISAKWKFWASKKYSRYLFPNMEISTSGVKLKNFSQKIAAYSKITQICKKHKLFFLS